jgi:hypothetical protein
MFSDENLRTKPWGRMYTYCIEYSLNTLRNTLSDQLKKYPKIKFRQIEKYLLII